VNEAISTPIPYVERSPLNQFSPQITFQGITRKRGRSSEATQNPQEIEVASQNAPPLSSSTPIPEELLERGGDSSGASPEPGIPERVSKRARKEPDRYQPADFRDRAHWTLNYDDNMQWLLVECETANPAQNAHEPPKDLEEALAGPEAEEWKQGYKREWGAIDTTGTLVKCTPEVREKVRCGNIRVHDLRTILTLKLNEEGVVVRHKVRTVVRGFTMRQGVEFYYTHSPTARLATVRFAISQGVQNQWDVNHYDVPNAYLNGVQEALVVVRLPTGWNKIMGDKLGKDGDLVIMARSLYGAPNAGRTWNCVLHTFLTKEGYTRVKVEPCHYFKKRVECHIVFISTYTVYVDDLLEGGNDKGERARMKTALEKEYQIRDLGRVSFFLGMSCKWDEFGGCKMSQTAYIIRILQRFRMADAAPAQAPYKKGYKPCEEDCPQTEEDQLKMNKIPYQEAIGSLMYLVVCTRPELAYIVAALARYSHNPGKGHWTAAKVVFAYLVATSDLGLYFKYDPEEHKPGSNGLVDPMPMLWTDSSFNDADRGKTTLGELLFCRNHLISWKSALSKHVPQSAHEAEIFSANSGCRELEWFLHLVGLVYDYKTKAIVCIDNDPAISTIKNAKVTVRTKSLKPVYYYVRELYEDGTIDPRWVDTDDQLADICTKAEGFPLFKKNRESLGIV
jgi:hypothetical protein